MPAVSPSTPAFIELLGSQAKSFCSYSPPIAKGCKVRDYRGEAEIFTHQPLKCHKNPLSQKRYQYINIWKLEPNNSGTVPAEHFTAVTHHQCRAAGMSRAIQPGSSVSSNLQIKYIYFVPGMILLKVLFELMIREACNSIYASPRHKLATDHFESTWMTSVNFICVCLNLGIISVHSKNCCQRITDLTLIQLHVKP